MHRNKNGPAEKRARMITSLAEEKLHSKRARVALKEDATNAVSTTTFEPSASGKQPLMGFAVLLLTWTLSTTKRSITNVTRLPFSDTTNSLSINVKLRRVGGPTAVIKSLKLVTMLKLR